MREATAMLNRWLARLARACLVLALALLVPATGTAKGEIIDRVLAVVSGRLITLSDVRTSLELGLVDTARRAGGTAATLDALIDRTLVLQEVDRYAPPEPDKAMVAARADTIERELGSPQQVAARLAALGVSDEWIRRWVRDDLRIQAYIDQRFSGSFEPTQDEIENEFRQHPDAFIRDGQTLAPAAAQQFARERVMAARRVQLVADWIAGLRRRADISRPGAE
jgi:hypothetical protein